MFSDECSMFNYRIDQWSFQSWWQWLHTGLFSWVIRVWWPSDKTERSFSGQYTDLTSVNWSTKWKVNWLFQWKVSCWKISCNGGLSLIIEQWTLGFDRKKHNFQKIIWGVSAIFCQLRHQSYHTTINSTTSTVSHWKGKLVRVFIIATGLMFLSIILVLWRFVVCRLW